MKKLLCLSLALLLILSAGCAWLQTQDPVKNANRAGRIAVMMWTAESEKFTPEQKQAVVTVWAVFHSVIADGGSGTAIQDLVKTKITTMKLSESDKKLALQFFDFAWNEFNDSVTLPADAQKALEVLKAFDAGVSSGLGNLK